MTCMNEFCGDGIIQNLSGSAYFEECDDGNTAG